MKIFGKAQVTYDGNQLRIDKGASLDLGGTQRNEVVGVEVEGYAEEAKPAMVECEAFVDANFDLDAVAAADDVTVLFTMDTGQRYVLAHAWLQNTPKASAASQGGKVPLTFVAAKSEKL